MYNWYIIFKMAYLCRKSSENCRFMFFFYECCAFICELCNFFCAIGGQLCEIIPLRITRRPDEFMIFAFFRHLFSRVRKGFQKGIIKFKQTQFDLPTPTNQPYYHKNNQCNPDSNQNKYL